MFVFLFSFVKNEFERMAEFMLVVKSSIARLISEVEIMGGLTSIDWLVSNAMYFCPVYVKDFGW